MPFMSRRRRYSRDLWPAATCSRLLGLQRKGLPVSSDFAPTWRFDEEHAKVSGTVVDRREFTGRWGPLEILDIQTEDGVRSVFCDKKALKDWINAENPQPGDSVEMKYEGREYLYNNDGTPWTGDDGVHRSRVLFNCAVTKRGAELIVPDIEDEDIPW